MYIKYFKNKPINKDSWLLANRFTFKLKDNLVLLGNLELLPYNINSVEKKSWFTKNYYIVTFTSGNDDYVLSLSDTYYKQFANKFPVQNTGTDANTIQNLFSAMLIAGTVYSCFNLIQHFVKN